MLSSQHSRVPTDGSFTMAQRDTLVRSRSPASANVSTSGSEVEPMHGVLHLRGGPRSQQHVAWTEDVVDNEKMGKKKSKICCIYHKPRRFDESSSSSSSSSDSEPDERPNKPKPNGHPKPDAGSGSDSDSDSDFTREGAQPGGRLRFRAHRHRRHRPYPYSHSHTHPGPCEHKAEDKTDDGEHSLDNSPLSGAISTGSGLALDPSDVHGPDCVHSENTQTQAQQLSGIYNSDSDSVNAYERQPRSKGKGKAKDMDKAKSTRAK